MDPSQDRFVATLQAAADQLIAERLGAERVHHQLQLQQERNNWSQQQQALLSQVQQLTAEKDRLQADFLCQQCDWKQQLQHQTQLADPLRQQQDELSQQHERELAQLRGELQAALQQQSVERAQWQETQTKLEALQHDVKLASSYRAKCKAVSESLNKSEKTVAFLKQRLKDEKQRANQHQARYEYLIHLEPHLVAPELLQQPQLAPAQHSAPAHPAAAAASPSARQHEELNALASQQQPLECLEAMQEEVLGSAPQPPTQPTACESGSPHQASRATSIPSVEVFNSENQSPGQEALEARRRQGNLAGAILPPEVAQLPPDAALPSSRQSESMDTTKAIVPTSPAFSSQGVSSRQTRLDQPYSSTQRLAVAADGDADQQLTMPEVDSESPVDAAAGSPVVAVAGAAGGWQQRARMLENAGQPLMRAASDISAGGGLTDKLPLASITNGAGSIRPGLTAPAPDAATSRQPVLATSADLPRSAVPQLPLGAASRPVPTFKTKWKLKGGGAGQEAWDVLDGQPEGLLSGAALHPIPEQAPPGPTAAAAPPALQQHRPHATADGLGAAGSRGGGGSGRGRWQGEGYKYQEVVRKRREREELRGVACLDCAAWYQALSTWGHGAPDGLLQPACGHAASRDAGGAPRSPVDQMRQEASRHRFKYAPPATPAGFWDMGFGDSLDSRFNSTPKRYLD